MTINVDRKGKIGERELAAFLREHVGGELRRSAGQEFGGHVAPDIIGLAGWWVEAKRKERPSFGKWLVKLLADITRARSLDKPLLCWRPNRGAWWAVLRLHDMCSLIRYAEALARENDEMRARLGLPPREPVHEAGPRQITLDEVRP
jgi:Holliday junction resolvase